MSGRDHVKVTSLVPANGDPHDFEPSPDNAKTVKEATVTFLSGEGLEGWFERLAKASGAKIKPVVVSKGIKTHEMQEDGETITDPHVWNTVPNVLFWVDNIEASSCPIPESQREQLREDECLNWKSLTCNLTKRYDIT